MFLTSDACHSLELRQRTSHPWSATSILFVSHDWDPARDGAEALAGRRLVNALLAAGARVHVVAAGCADQEFASCNYAVTVVPPRRFPVTKIGRAFQMVRSTIPEAAGQWVDGAVLAGLDALSSLPSDAIIYGRASPGSSNIVAWQLAQRTGLPWAAHFSDEWPPFQVLANGRRWLAPYKSPLFRLWRERIVRDAGALTFTNPLQGEQVLGAASANYRGKAFVVTHLPSHLTPGNHPFEYDTFRIVHSGNFYPPDHTAAAAMQGLRLWLERHPAHRCRVRFIQAGWSAGDLPEWTTRCQLDDVVEVVGRLDQDGVIALLDKASLLLAVDYARPNSRTMLSKLPDYVNARRPILAITAPGSSIARLFHDDGAGLTAHYASPEQVADRIGTVFDAWERRRLEAFVPRPTTVESFSKEHVLGELAGAFAVARKARANPAGTRTAVHVHAHARMNG